MRLSIVTKIALLSILALVVLSLVSYFGITQLRKNTRLLYEINEGYLPLSKHVTQIDLIVKTIQRDVNRILDVHDPRLKRILIQNTRHYAGNALKSPLGQAQAHCDRMILFTTNPKDKEFYRVSHERLSSIQVNAEKFSTALDLFFEQLNANQDTEEALRNVRNVEESEQRQLKVLSLYLDRRITQSVLNVEAETQQSVWLNVIFLLSGLGVSLVILVMMVLVLRPVGQLKQAARQIKEGSFDKELQISGNDELAALAMEFEGMRLSLLERDHALKERQEQLIQSERMAAVGRVSARIVHEIRNPLSSIGLNMEMLSDELEQNQPDAVALIVPIQRQLERLNQITEQYLRFARLPKPRLKPENLAALVEEQVRFVKLEMQQAGIDLILEGSETYLPIQADEDQISQAVLNLLRNAKEAMPDGGTITIRLHNEDHIYCVLDVDDQGIGIEDDALDKLFQPFYSTKETGTGLGLAMIRQIVQDHRGDIRFTCLEPKGTRFRVRLPYLALGEPLEGKE